MFNWRNVCRFCCSSVKTALFQRRLVIVYTPTLARLFLSSLRLLYMSRVMRKPDFCICENKDADQLRGNRKADLRLCFGYTDIAILYFLNPKFRISCHFLRLCSPVYVRPKTGISERGSYINGTPMYGQPAQTPTTQPFLKLFCSRI